MKIINEQKCQCRYFLREPIYVHLYGCPVGSEREIAEYKRLPWYKRIFQTNPENLYSEHFKKA